MANALVRENTGEMIRRAGVFPRTRASREMNIAGCQLAVNPGIGKILNVVYRIVEIKIVIVHAVHEIAQIVDAGHGKAALDNVRMFEERICGMIRAEGGAHRGNRYLRLAIAPNERHDFFAEIRIENGLYVTAMEGMRAFVVKAEPVDGID